MRGSHPASIRREHAATALDRLPGRSRHRTRYTEYAMQLRLACCASAAALSVSFVPALHAQDTPEPVETAEPAAREQTASPDPAARRVDILNYAVSGNTLLSTVFFSYLAFIANNFFILAYKK